MTLSSRHRIRNSSSGGLRPSTLPLGHGGSPQYWIYNFTILNSKWSKYGEFWFCAIDMIKVIKVLWILISRASKMIKVSRILISETIKMIEVSRIPVSRYRHDQSIANSVFYCSLSPPILYSFFTSQMWEDYPRPWTATRVLPLRSENIVRSLWRMGWVVRKYRTCHNLVTSTVL